MRHVLLWVVTICLFTGCSTLHHGSRGEAPKKATWAVLPFVNNTETPYAGERAEAITQALLYARGIEKVAVMPQEPATGMETLGDRGLKRRMEGLEWAREQKIRYVILGTVTEWRYKVGLDGEPVAGMTLQLMDLENDAVLWSATSGKSGWSRESVSALAQQVLENMIATIGLN